VAACSWKPSGQGTERGDSVVQAVCAGCNGTTARVRTRRRHCTAHTGSCFARHWPPPAAAALLLALASPHACYCLSEVLCWSAKKRVAIPEVARRQGEKPCDPSGGVRPRPPRGSQGKGLRRVSDAHARFSDANAMDCPGRPGFAGVISRVAELRLFCRRAARHQNAVGRAFR